MGDAGPLRKRRRHHGQFLAASALLDGEPFGDDLGFNAALWDAALDNPLYHGVQRVLPPGTYQLRLELSVLGGGFPADVGLRPDTVVPVPALGVPGTLIPGLALSTTGTAALRRRHA